ncbi:MAG: ABC transporter ATP-binding protein [Candidatus Thorarchaeota archaeon]
MIWRGVQTTTDCNAISIQKMTKTFRDVIALNELTLDVEQGIFGLIGPNGAGKTTLLRILLGLIKPDSGSAQIFENDIINRPLGYLHEIGVLHENPYFPPLMTPRQYLKQVGLLYSERVPVRDLLSMVGLIKTADRQIRHLSAGMYRRLGLAQALVGRPKLVFLDEPTSNLDVSGRDLVIKLIVRIYKEENVSFFITSHILSELERACHKVAFINAGRIIEEGNIEELVRKHTRYRYRIISSDSWKLEQILREEKGIVDILVDSSTSVIIEVTPGYLNDIEARLEGLADNIGIKIYVVETTGSLEDVFRKVISHE